MMRRSLIIILLINAIKGTIRIGDNFLGSYCYGAEYTMVVTGEVSCNQMPYNNSKISINECDESGAVCKNVSNVPLIGNTFNHSAKFVNQRSVDFYLIIEIYHKCCNSPFKTMNYDSKLKKNLQSYDFKCGPSFQNVKNYGKIELPIEEKCYCENYNININGNIYCGSNLYKNVTIDVYLCAWSYLSCTKVEHIKNIGNTFSYNRYLSNARKSDSILKIDINHNCCGLRRDVSFFPSTKTLYPFENYLKCGDEENTKYYERIDLSETYCSSRDFASPFGKK